MTYKVLTVVGARPQFIKAGMISRLLREHDRIDEVMVHTGQHYDREMSQVFFDELGLAKPKINLGVNGGSHAVMTGRMMISLESAMIDESPDCVLVYGDTNSTLAAALAAAKLGIPLCHAESGARMRARENPEEINRICTDHLARVNCAPTPTCLDNLFAEGLKEGSFFTGDLMYDAFKHYSAQQVNKEYGFELLTDGRYVPENGFCYLTCHRQENTSLEQMRELFAAIAELDMDVVYPVHPRMIQIIEQLAPDEIPTRLKLLRPVGYFESLVLLERCNLVITDSGGLQREAFFAEKKCVTLLPFSSAEELLTGQRNTLVADIDCEAIVEASRIKQTVDPGYMPFGEGDAASKIIDKIELLLLGGYE